MRDLNIVSFSHSKFVYIESIKIIFLHVINGISVWIKLYKTRSKNASYEPSQEPRAVAILEAGNSVMVPVCFFKMGDINYFNRYDLDVSCCIELILKNNFVQ